MTGCSLWPSTWRLGGSPLAKNERAQKQLAAAQSEAVAGAQAAVHQTGFALEALDHDLSAFDAAGRAAFAPAAAASVPLASSRRATSLARDFNREAAALLGQAHGAPSAADEEKWRALVAGLLSENAAIRAAAERDRDAQLTATADLSRRLAAATAHAQRASARALDYARERDGLADFAGELKLAFLVLVGLAVAATVLSIAARFFPAFGVVAKLLGGLVAPGLAYAAHRAETGLQRVGAGLATLRRSGAIDENLIALHLDSALDTDHQRVVAAGAKR